MNTFYHYSNWKLLPARNTVNWCLYSSLITWTHLLARSMLLSKKRSIWYIFVNLWCTSSKGHTRTILSINTIILCSVHSNCSSILLVLQPIPMIYQFYLKYCSRISFSISSKRRLSTIPLSNYSTNA